MRWREELGAYKKTGGDTVAGEEGADESKV